MFDQKKRISLLSRDAYPPHVMRAIEWHIARSRAAIRGGRSCRAMTSAPAFALTDQRGNLVSSNDLLDRGPLVVQFYRGTWCPYASAELEQLSKIYSSIVAVRAGLVVITPQATENARAYREQHPVPFPVLVDADFSVISSFGVIDELPDNLRSFYRNGVRVNLAWINADGSWRLPIASRFIIDSDDSIVAANVDPDFRFTEPAEQTLTNVARMWPLPRRTSEKPSCGSLVSPLFF
jgi:peroxiredoxin